MEIYTIGFTQKPAEQFFDALLTHGIRRLVDVRLNNTSQLAAFTKRDDLAYFLRAVGGIAYEHQPLLAPSAEILAAYKTGGRDWPAYEAAFVSLLSQRRVEEVIDRAPFAERSVLLCAEPTADHCHRRLVAEYLALHWGGVTVCHL